MSWSLRIRSACIAFAAVAGLAAGNLAANEVDFDLQQDEALESAQNPFDNVAFFYPLLDKDKLVQLMINDGQISAPPAVDKCHSGEGENTDPQLVSGSTYSCGDWLKVNPSGSSSIRPCNQIQFQDGVSLSADQFDTSTWDSASVRGFSFRPSQSDVSVVGGLSSEQSSKHTSFGAHCDEHGKFQVVENGNARGTYGTYSPHSLIEVVINHASEVEYRVDGDIRYVSTTQVPPKLFASVASNEVAGPQRWHSATWSPGPAAHASILAIGAAVDFKSQRGMSTNVGTGMLRALGETKSEALSVYTVSGTDHITGFRFQPAQNDQQFVMALTAKQTSHNADSARVAVNCKADGTLSISEDVGATSIEKVPNPSGYQAGDVIEMSLNDVGAVEVKVNGESCFNSSATPDASAEPLAVEAYAPSGNPAAYNVKWTGMKACTEPESYGHPVGFKGFVGATQLARGHFKKVLGDGWTSGSATSLKHFTSEDTVSGVSFQIASTRKKLMVGISKTPLRRGHVADHAAHCENDGRLHIYERGQHVGEFGQLLPHDVVSITVNIHGLVQFRVGGLVRYTSKARPSYPINVVAALHDGGSEIYNMKWVRAVEDESRGVHATLIADLPTGFDEIHGAASIEAGTFTKLATLPDAWNAGAVSVDGLSRADHVHGVSFRPRFSDRWLTVGLSRAGTMGSWDNSDFAAHCMADGTFVVLQKGQYVGEYGHYNAGDRIDIVVNEHDHVEYKVQGQIRFVSKSKAVFPLSVKTFFHHRQAEVEVLWSGCIVHPPYEGLLVMSDPSDLCARGAGHATQDDLVGFTLWDGLIALDGFKKGGLEKFKDISPDHYGTAISFDEITDASQGVVGFAFQPLQNTSRVTMGLTLSGHLEQRIVDRDIDVAVILNPGGTVDVTESGTLSEHIGHYSPFDDIRIRLNEYHIPEVWVGGEKKWQGSAQLSFPLRIVAMIKDHQAVVYNVRWVGSGEHQFHQADGAPVEFFKINGVGLLEKQRIRGVPGSEVIAHLHDLDYHSSAVSLRSIDRQSEVSGIEFQLPKSTSVLVGLAPVDDHHALDFAFQAHDGVVTIISKNPPMRRPLPPSKSNTYSIVINGDMVEFRQGCQTLMQLPVLPDLEFPLFAHVLVSETSEISNLVWIASGQCTSEVVHDHPIVHDYLSGVGPVGAGSLRKFASSDMDYSSFALSANEIKKNSDDVSEGFTFHAPEANTWAMVGFISAGGEAQTIHDMDHALFFDGKQGVSVWEKGSLVGDFGDYEAGVPVDIVINRAGEVEYSVNGLIRHTSVQRPNFPLKVSAFILNPGGQLNGLGWVARQQHPLGTPTRDQLVTFHRFRGGAMATSASTSGSLMKLSKSVAAWNAGAASEGAIATGEHHVKGVSFKLGHDDHHVGQLSVGLKKGVASGDGANPSVSYKAADFGVLLTRTGEFQVFEKGNFKGSFKHYSAEDKIRIEGNGKSVNYFVNDDLRYSSEEDFSESSHYYVDVALHDPAAEINEVTWL